MVFQYWHLVLVAAFAALVVGGLLAARRKMLLASAVTLLAVSGFMLYTLVLDEEYLDKDLNGRLDTLGFIGVPAVISLGIFIVLAVKRA